MNKTHKATRKERAAKRLKAKRAREKEKARVDKAKKSAAKRGVPYVPKGAAKKAKPKNEPTIKKETWQCEPPTPYRQMMEGLRTWVDGGFVYEVNGERVTRLEARMFVLGQLKEKRRK